MSTETLVSRAQLVLPSPSKTLQRLCKHFSHKVIAHWGTHQGAVDFDIGQCELLANKQQLQITCRSAQPNNLRDIEATIERHMGPMSGQITTATAIDWQR